MKKLSLSNLSKPVRDGLGCKANCQTPPVRGCLTTALCCFQVHRDAQRHFSRPLLGCLSVPSICKGGPLQPAEAQSHTTWMSELEGTSGISPSLSRWGSRGQSEDRSGALWWVQPEEGKCHLRSDDVRGTSFVLGPWADLGVTSPPILSLLHICTHAHLYPLGRCDCQEGELGRLPGERATLSGLPLLPVGPLSLPDCAGSWAKCRPHARNG